MADGSKTGWMGGPNFIRVKRFGANTSNSGPSGKRYRRFHCPNRKALPDRGAVIWLDPATPADIVLFNPERHPKAPHRSLRHQAELAAMHAHRARQTGKPWSQGLALPVSS